MDVVSETRVVRDAIRQFPDLDRRGVADALDITEEELRYRLRLLQLPTTALEKIATGEIPPDGARPLLSMISGQHNHEDIIQKVVAALEDGLEQPPHNATLIATLLTEAWRSADWYQLRLHLTLRGCRS